MKYLKKFESLREEFPIETIKEEDKAKVVPGFEGGTIDPEDTEPWELDGETHEAESERYKTFLKIVKERNFKETKDKIIINLRRIGQDYCMTIFEYRKHLEKFLNDELKGKYVSDGFKDILNDQKHEGIISRVVILYTDSYDCSSIYSLKLKGEEYNDDYGCDQFITINKFKSTANKYNL